MTEHAALTTLARRCPACRMLYSVEQQHSCAAASETARSDHETEPVQASDTDELIGAVLGERYEILCHLGQGGMGAVYKARHLLLQSHFAVKFLLAAQSEEAGRRFLREARLASRIQHPNTVQIADFGLLPDGRSYLVMEFLQGPTLGQVLRGGPLEPRRACRIAAQIARGLQAIHDQGIIHRGLFAPSGSSAGVIQQDTAAAGTCWNTI